MTLHVGDGGRTYSRTRDTRCGRRAAWLGPELRAEILDGQRKKSYALEHPVVGTVTIRDQKS